MELPRCKMACVSIFIVRAIQNTILCVCVCVFFFFSENIQTRDIQKSQQKKNPKTKKKTKNKNKTQKQKQKQNRSIFYSDIEVAGSAKFPRKGPVILAINHANSLVDAAVAICYSPRSVRLTCKDTLLKDPYFGCFIRGVESIGLQRKLDHENPDNIHALSMINRELDTGYFCCVFFSVFFFLYFLTFFKRKRKNTKTKTNLFFFYQCKMTHCCHKFGLNLHFMFHFSFTLTLLCV